MPYVTASGQVVNKQPWGLKYFMDLFGSLFHVFILFFQTMFPMDLFRNPSSSQNHGDGRGGPPRPPRPRFGRLGGCGPAAPPMGGGG